MSLIDLILSPERHLRVIAEKSRHLVIKVIHTSTNEHVEDTNWDHACWSLPHRLGIQEMHGAHVCICMTAYVQATTLWNGSSRLYHVCPYLCKLHAKGVNEEMCWSLLKSLAWTQTTSDHGNSQNYGTAIGKAGFKIPRKFVHLELSYLLSV